jgi:RNA polymerase sigma-70 factor, ECF subfamily
MLLDNKTDEELMRLYQKGTEEAFRILYDRHSSKVYGFLKAKVRNQERAKDVFQEVFVKVHKSKHLYNSSFPFLPWLFTITKNALTDEIRQFAKVKKQVSVDESIASPELQPEPSLSEVLPYIGALPSNQRQALELRYIEDKTFEEISETLKTSPVNVRKILSRGVQRVRELLKEGEKP